MRGRPVDNKRGSRNDPRQGKHIEPSRRASAEHAGMLFCSQQFLLFFAVVFVVYWAMPWRAARVWFLLAASYFFYMSWSAQLALIICLSCVMDYFLARGMGAVSSRVLRRLFLAISLIANLGLLCYFKYANFFLQSLGDSLHALGATTSLPVLQVLLPIGISFYTFEAINYTIDVYRRRVPAERNLAHFMLFITFFPHLIAGPIVRARDFLPQIARPKHFDWARLHLGAQFFLLGVVKKLAIADRMPMWTDNVFANPEQYNTGAVWLAVLAYAIQIYCDFSGYTDMAIGAAHMLGYKLARNFDMPYLSANISEFWRRWHISLSSWLRDYLFIPLGGSRGTRWQTYRNLLITMTLGGLWHGASWTFVVWGLLHGLLLIGHRTFQDCCTRMPALARWLTTQGGTALRVTVTFLAVSVCWLFFRATTFGIAATMLWRMVVPHSGLGSQQRNFGLVLLALLLVGAHAIARSGAWKPIAVRVPAPVLGMAYAVVLTLALVLAPHGSKAFIYFQF
jgi:alginate O-acetyltransferase complex protein AlgI